MTKTLEETRQELFERVYTGLQNQGWYQSLDSKGHCAYRGDNGRRCAAGHLLPDSEYDPVYDSGGGFRVHKIDYFQEHLGEHIDLIGSLQDLHDEDIDTIDPDSLKKKFDNFAEWNGFTVPTT